MTDLTPGELARLDQIHTSIMHKLAELISSAAEGIRTEGEPQTASALAGQAAATDHSSVATLLAAALIRCARYQMADEKRLRLGDPIHTEERHEVRHRDTDGNTDVYPYDRGFPEERALASAVHRHHNNPELPYVHTAVIRYTETTYRTDETVILELGTRTEAGDV